MPSSMTESDASRIQSTQSTQATGATDGKDMTSFGFAARAQSAAVDKENAARRGSSANVDSGKSGNSGSSATAGQQGSMKERAQSLAY